MDQPIPDVRPSTSFLRRIFVGDHGIRAGWSIGLFLVVMGILTALFFLPIRYLLRFYGLAPDSAEPAQLGLSELAGILGVLGASMMMARIEGKHLISYGLEGPRRLRTMIIGLLSGLFALSALVGVLSLSGYLIFDGRHPLDWNAAEYAFGWGTAFLLVGVYEEYLSRGYLQATLARGIGFWWSALLLSTLFGCTHLFNQGESPIGIFSAALVGLVFCVSLRYWGNLWWAIGFHASWDWAQSYLWGTSDSGLVVQGHLFSVHPQGNVLWSGGATGPEGSILVFPLLSIIGLALWLALRRRDGTAV